MENGIFHCLALITRHRSQEVKPPYVKWFLMLWGALLWKSALSRQPTIFLHFEMGSNLEVNVHLWIWIFFLFFASTDSKGKMNCVNTVAAPWGDSPQIKVHFMTQIEGWTWWYEAYLSGNHQAASIDLLFYSSATGQPAVYILTFHRYISPRSDLHLGQSHSCNQGSFPPMVSLNCNFWLPSLLVLTTDEASVQSLFWSWVFVYPIENGCSYMKLTSLVLTSSF